MVGWSTWYQFFEQIFSDYWKACSSRACLFVCSSFIVSVESDLLVFNFGLLISWSSWEPKIQIDLSMIAFCAIYRCFYPYIKVFKLHTRHKFWGPGCRPPSRSVRFWLFTWIIVLFIRKFSYTRLTIYTLMLFNQNLGKNIRFC